MEKMTMGCKTCHELLAEYQLWATLLRDAVLNIPRALGDDPSVFLEQADRFRLKCNHAGHALGVHRRQEHTLP
jgi:hypothetical protein